MTDQTEAAEVGFHCDTCGSSTHDTRACVDHPARVDWWWTEEGRTAHTAAAEARGAERVLAAVEAAIEQQADTPFRAKMVMLAAARAAAAEEEAH